MSITNPLRSLVLPRPTGWRVFALLLMLALGSEYWEKEPLSVGGLAVPWPGFVAALLFMPLIVPPGEWRWSRLLRIPRSLGPMLVFWLCCAISIIGVAYAQGRSEVTQFARTFVHLTAYVVFVYTVVKFMTWARFFLFLRLYYALGIGAAALALLQYLNGAFGLFPWLAAVRFQSAEYSVGEGLTAGFRTASIFGEPSWAARYYVHFIAIALSFWWRTEDRRHLAALTLFVLAFYTANSLLGYVILLTFVAVAVLAQMWRRNVFSLSHRRKVVLAGAAYACLLLWLTGASLPLPDLTNRSIARVSLMLEGSGAAGNRIDSVRAGLEVWRRSPVFGVGLGNIPAHVVEFYRDPEWVLRSKFGVDALYVALLAETGIVGVLGFLWFWFKLLAFSGSEFARRDPDPRSVQAYLTGRFLQVDLLAQAVGMWSAADYLNPHLWTVVAIVLSSQELICRVASAKSAASRLAQSG